MADMSAKPGDKLNQNAEPNPGIKLPAAGKNPRA